MKSPLEGMMQDILDKALQYQETYNIIGRGHYLAADSSSFYNRLLGVPVVIITAAVGTAIFTTFSESTATEPYKKAFAGMVCLLGTVLSALQTSLGFAQTAEKHKAAAEAYRAMKREFEMFELRYRLKDDSFRDQAIADLEKMMESLKKLAQGYPSLPDKFYDKGMRESQRMTRALTPQ